MTETDPRHQDHGGLFREARSPADRGLRAAEQELGGGGQGPTAAGEPGEAGVHPEPAAGGELRHALRRQVGSALGK